MKVQPNTLCQITGGEDPWLAQNRGRLVLTREVCRCHERHWLCEALQHVNSYFLGIESVCPPGREVVIEERYLKPYQKPDADEDNVFTTEPLPGEKVQEAA